MDNSGGDSDSEQMNEIDSADNISPHNNIKEINFQPF